MFCKEDREKNKENRLKKMVKTALFVFLIVISNCFGQSIKEINRNLNLSNSFEFEKEIRIYNDYTISNGIEVFRMFDRGRNDWVVDIYYYNKTFKSATKIIRTEFKNKNLGELKLIDANSIWLNLLLCDIENLPSIDTIEYKLKVSSIEFIDGEYEVIQRKKKALDGHVYNVFFRNGKKKNHIVFDNPESYLEIYPNVDELVSYNQILSVIKKEFNLWND
jgi:hypothetical protein